MKKLKKMKKKWRKRNAWGAFNKQFKQRCDKCGKYGLKHCNRKHADNKKTKKMITEKKKMTIKRKNLTEIAIIALSKGISVMIVMLRNKEKEIKKQRGLLMMAIMMSCVMFIDIGEQKEVKKKVWFIKNVKFPTEVCMLCTKDGKTFHLFTKNT